MNENWLSPLNRIILQGAIRSSSDTVELRDGRVLKIEYDRSKVFGEDAVYVSPVKGLVPRGEFRLSKVLDEVWLTGNEGVPQQAMENIYVKKLGEFIKSSDKGVDVMDAWPDLEGRQLTTIRQGFSAAISRTGKLATARGIECHTIEGKVYLFKDVGELAQN